MLSSVASTPLSPLSSLSTPPTSHSHHPHLPATATLHRPRQRFSSDRLSRSVVHSTSNSSLTSNRSTSSSGTVGNNMSDYRHMRSGSLNIPSSQAHNSVNAVAVPPPPPPPPSSQGRFDGPRSPPNTSHVPCKFFRQGACQAGSACPFSHDLGIAAETVCKYFAKGNCKFGPKCANVHVLADGRRINYGKNGITIGQPMHIGNRISPTGYSNTNSALTNSFMRADATSTPYSPAYGYPVSPSDPYKSIDRQPSLENVPIIDTTYSHTSSQYGSPREEDPSRLGLGLSPVAAKGLSVLDAPLPASFDSNGISNAARYPGGPWPSSVPSQFGLESPSPSLNAAKESRTSEALKRLHHSAFGSNEHLSAVAAGSSPPSQPSSEYFGQRPMHSSRFAKTKMLSSSAPRAIAGAIDRDWESEFPFLEEDYLPDNLKDLLTPTEKARRESRAADDNTNGHPRGNGASPGVAGMSGTGTPNAETTSKFGSPVASSPSRWGPLFQRHFEEHEAKKHAAAANAGVFGHVGSPLRQSSLSADVVRPKHSSRTSSIEGLSALTQQLQRTRIDNSNGGGDSPLLHPHAHMSRPSNGGRSTSERHVSSSSISSSARYTTPIGEEDGEFIFNMDENDDRDSTIRAKKRTSGVGTAVGAWSHSNYAGKKDDGSAANGRIVDVGGNGR